MKSSEYAIVHGLCREAAFCKTTQRCTVPYNDSTVFDFPVGTALIKTFYYPADFRDPSKGRKIIETRVLIHEANGWKALPYIWNEDQTEAELDVAGGSTTVSYVDDPRDRQQLFTEPRSRQPRRFSHPPH